MLRSILFTHTDLDGAGCRIVYELAHMCEKKGEDYLVVHCENGSIDYSVRDTLVDNVDYVDINTEICFADIVPTNTVLSNLKDMFSTIRIFDHHNTNMECKDEIEDAVVVFANELGIMQCGTSLIFQHYAGLDGIEIFDKKYNQELISEFVETVRSYDTFDWKNTGNETAKQLNTLFFQLGMERFCNKYISLLSSTDKDQKLIDDICMEFVSARMESEQRVIDSLTIDDVYRLDIFGYNAAVLLGNRGANISDLAYQFLEKYPEFDIFVGVSIGKKGIISFRTNRDDIDLGREIAQPLGGGGHPKASGCTLPYYMMTDIVELIEYYITED